MSKFRLYIDESGNSDLGSSENPIHRFLSLTGVIVDLAYVGTTLFPQLEALKRKYFNSHPDDPLVLHRKELLQAKFPFENLRVAETRRAFDAEFLGLLEAWEYTVITVCLDKMEHKKTYQVWTYDPYHYCLALLLERYIMFLERKKCSGDVLAESRGGKEDQRLKNSFLNLWREGTQYIGPERFQATLTSKQLKVKSKANNISGLQIADVLSHPSRSEILLENGKRMESLAPFARKIVSILNDKYYRVDEKMYGKKFL